MYTVCTLIYLSNPHLGRPLLLVQEPLPVLVALGHGPRDALLLLLLELEPTLLGRLPQDLAVPKPHDYSMRSPIC